MAVMAAQVEKEALMVVAAKAVAEGVGMVAACLRAATGEERVDAMAVAAEVAVRLRPKRSLVHPRLRSCHRSHAQNPPAWRGPPRQRRRQHWCGRPGQG